jgi:hypothetical protein
MRAWGGRAVGVETPRRRRRRILHRTRAHLPGGLSEAAQEAEQSLRAGALRSKHAGGPRAPAQAAKPARLTMLETSV